jgi:carbon-monoxide dehydrogenase small subunit
MSEERCISLSVNGTSVEVSVAPQALLVDVLRDDLGLAATHQGCADLICGACTVLLDGRPVKSCAVLAVQADGVNVRTADGLEEDDPVAVGFREEHGLHCGYCGPGMMMSAAALLAEHPQPTEEQIRQAISGNVCRCTGYVNIIKAVHYAAKRRAGAAA